MSVEPGESVEMARPPWLPVTNGRVARFASAPVGHVFRVAVVAALLCGVVAAHFVAMAWWPVVRAAAEGVPDGTVLRGGRLEWPTNAVQALAESRFLAITAVPLGTKPLPTAADVTLELRPSGVEAYSLLGYTVVPYPRQWTLDLEPRGLQAQCDAWRPQVIAWTGIGVALGLMGLWVFGGLLLALPLLSYALLSERRTTFFGCWRMAMAAFLPGTGLGFVVLLLYTYQQVALAELMLAAGAGVLITALLLVVAPLRLPAQTSRSSEAEDAEEDAPDEDESTPEKPDSDTGATRVPANPFASAPRPPKSKRPNPFADSDESGDR